MTFSLQLPGEVERHLYVSVCSVVAYQFIGELLVHRFALSDSHAKLVQEGALELVNSKEGQVAYAVLSSRPYSWQRGGDFLNYGQWKHAATWAVAYGYLRSPDLDVTAGQSKGPPTRNPPPREHEKA